MLKYPDHPPILRFILGIGLLFVGVLLVACSPAAAPEKQPPVSTLSVVMDENYPPYTFRDEQGKLQGILIDQWKLWEYRMGVKVEITALPWGEALARMKAGEFDVIDTAFYTLERTQYLDFTDPYAQINIRIFFQKNISGIASVEDLKGFKVAVKTGDASADDLRNQGGIDLTYYDNYEQIIQAAQRKEVTIFVIDEPPALYFLYKFGIYDQFNYSASLGGNKFYRAVHKGEASTLALVKDGFSRITEAEYQEIDGRWLGSSLTDSLEQFMPYLTLAAVLVALIILVLFTFNRMLQSRVQARTLELQEALNSLQRSETHFREAIEFFPVPVSIANNQGKILSVNRKFLDEYGYSLEDIPSVAEWLSRAYPDPEYRAKVQAQWDEDVAEAVKNGTSTTLREYKVTCKDGSQRDVEIVMHTIGDLWVASFNNVTGRKQVEAALQESETIFSSFLEHSPVYVFFKDKNIRTLRLSKNYEQMLGVPISEALGKTMDELFPSELAKSMVADDLRILNEAQQVDVVEELNGRIFETTKFPIFKDGQPFILAGFTVDITDRKHAEEALRESEQKYRTLFETTTQGIVYHRSDTGQIIAANPAAERILGLSLDQMQGRTSVDPLWRTIHEDGSDFPGETHPAMVAIKTGDSVHNVVMGVFNPAINDYRWININAVPQFSQGEAQPSLVYTIFDDITERRRAEIALRESEENYRNLVELSPEGIVVHRDGTVIFVNPATVKLLHARDSDEILGKPVIDFVHPEMQSVVTERIRQMTQEGVTVPPLEEKFLCLDGTVVDVEVVAMPIHYEGQPSVQVIARDITERKHSAEALQQSEQRFRTLIENSADALTLLNADGTVFYEGPTVKRLTGYSAAERLGKSSLENIYPEDLHYVKNTLTRIVAVPGLSVSAEFRSIRQDGTIWWTDATATNLLQDPSVRAIVVNYRDITVRKQAEENLRESEERFRQIVEASPMGMHMYQLQGERLVFTGANQAADRILGVDNSQFIGKTIEDAFPPLVDTEIPERYRRAALEGTPWEMVQVDYDYDGIRGAYETHAFQTGPGRMVVTFLDITERKKAQADLEKNEKRNRAIVTALPDLLFEISSDGRFLDCIASDSSRFLIPPEQAIGRLADELLPAELAALTMEKVRQALSSGEMEVYDYSIQLNQKTEYFESRMTPLGSDSVLALVRDITESKQIEQALRQSEQRYRTLFEQANDAIFVETQDDQILDVNQHACQMLGYSREELLAMRVSDLIAPEIHRSGPAIRQELSEYGRKPFESLDVRKDGVKIPVEVTNSILPDGLALSIVRDITERKQAEDALRQSEAEVRSLNVELEQRVAERTAQLETTNRELEAFSYSVSHDLRAPLRAIDGFSRMVLEDHASQLDGEGKKLLGHVCVESQRMAQLIEALLNLSRMGRVEMRRETVQLSSLAQMILDGLRQSQPQRQVECFIADGLTAQGDTRLLSVVLENLLGNAWKFTSKREQAKIEFGMERRENEVVYFVRDNGAGFDMTYAEKLFGAFQRLHGQHEFEGTGIGLATVQRIISRHGGRVWAEAEVGKGATFYFTLG